MENAPNATPVRPFLARVTQASGHQFEIEDIAHLVVEVGPDLEIQMTTAAFGIKWMPTGCETMSGGYSWMRLIMAAIRGRLRED
jgi:hypothetical protein